MMNWVENKRNTKARKERLGLSNDHRTIIAMKIRIIRRASLEEEVDDDFRSNSPTNETFCIILFIHLCCFLRTPSHPHLLFDPFVIYSLTFNVPWNNFLSIHLGYTVVLRYTKNFVNTIPITRSIVYCSYSRIFLTTLLLCYTFSFDRRCRCRRLCCCGI
jgi:hypothetical protein